MTERDTKFLDSAKLLYQKLSIFDGGHETVISEYRNKYDKQEQQTLIAQFIYDWTEWTIDAMKQYIYDDVTAGFESVDDVDNFTEWPPTP